MEIGTRSTLSISTTSYILGLYLEHAATSGTTDFAIKDARIVIPDPTNYPNVAELWVQWNVNWIPISPEVRLIGSNWVTVSLNTDLTDDANLASTSPPSTGIVLTPNHTSISGLANKLATARTISLGGSLSGSTSFDGSSNVTINASINAGTVNTTQLADGSVTAPKLATGAITGSLGYTPVNKAGDTMMGDLFLPKVVTTEGTSGSGIRHIELRTSGLRWSMGLGANESGSNSGADFFLWSYDDAGNYLGDVLKAERASGRVVFNEISGRYDHQNRFVVSAFAGQAIAISGNHFTVLNRFFVTVPSGRSLYVRRVRAWFTSYFRVRVAAIAGGVWVAGQAVLDGDINQSILTGPIAGFIYVGVDNVSGSMQTVYQGEGAIIELEIR